MKKLFFLITALAFLVPSISFAQTRIDISCPNGVWQSDGRGGTTCVTSNGNGNPVAQTSGPCPNGGKLNSKGACDLGYTPLEPITGVTSDSNGNALDFPRLLARVYEVAIILGALFSVLMLTISGIRYMTTDVGGDKQKAKDRIRACIIGLVLIAASYLILRTINPQLVTFTLRPGTATVNTTPQQQVQNPTTSTGTSVHSDASACAASGGTFRQSTFLGYGPSVCLYSNLR